MRWDFLIIVLIAAAILTGAYFYNDLQNQAAINKIVVNSSTPAVSLQFFEGMRYPDKTISYSIKEGCVAKKREDIHRAFDILSNLTILRFVERQDGQIVFYCSSISPEQGEQSHFIAGEGGPSKVIANGTDYPVILSGKVSLYRTDKCDKPQVAVHEILHALGYDHNSNKNSILYPVTECNQEIDGYIVSSLNRIYSIESFSDLIVMKANASMKDRLLDYTVSVTNAGLKDSSGSSLVVYADGKEIRRSDIGALEIGTGKIIMVSDLYVSNLPEKLLFYIETKENELSKDNNNYELSLR